METRCLSLVYTVMMGSAQSEQEAAVLLQAVLEYCLFSMAGVILLEKSQAYGHSPPYGQHGRLFIFTVAGGHGLKVRVAGM